MPARRSRHAGISLPLGAANSGRRHHMNNVTGPQTASSRRQRRRRARPANWENRLSSTSRLTWCPCPVV